MKNSETEPEEVKRKVEMRLSLSDRAGLLFLPIGIVLIAAGLILGIRAGRIIYMLAFTAPGIPFAVMGIFFCVIFGRERKRKQKLLDEGEYVVAEITGAERTGRRADKIWYTAETEDRTSGVRHIFRSETVSADDHPLKLHTRIRVYVDPADYTVYYMDLHPILGTGEEN